MIYAYLKNGKWEEHNKPLKGKQYGFFGTRSDDTYGELHFKDNTMVRRARSNKELFGWLHDNVFIPFWGDTSIKLVKNI